MTGGDDEFVGILLELERWNPAYLLAVLENPEEPQRGDEEVSTRPSDLENARSAEHAAARLLEQLEEVMPGYASPGAPSCSGTNEAGADLAGRHRGPLAWDRTP